MSLDRMFFFVTSFYKCTIDSDYHSRTDQRSPTTLTVLQRMALNLMHRLPRGGGRFFLLKSIESSSWHLHPTILRAKNEDFFVFYFSM